MSRSLLGVIDKVYAAAVDPKLWPDALEALGRLAGGMGTTMISLSLPPDADSFPILISKDLADAANAYSAEWHSHDIRAKLGRNLGIKNRVVTERDYISRETVACDPFYQEFLRPFGLGAGASLVVSPNNNTVISLTIQRELQHGIFKKTEIDIMNTVLPHISRAIDFSSRLLLSQSETRTLTGVLERLSVAALLLDRNRKVVFMNSAAILLLTDGLLISNFRLFSTIPSEQEAIDRLIRWATSEHSDADFMSSATIRRHGGRKPLIVTAMPVRSDTPSELSRILDISSERALLFVVDPEKEADDSPLSYLRTIGLTASEARLAVSVGSGLSPGRAAEQLGIAEGTARIVLKRIFDKLGLHRQGELVRFISGIDFALGLVRRR